MKALVIAVIFVSIILVGITAVYFTGAHLPSSGSTMPGPSQEEKDKYIQDKVTIKDSKSVDSNLVIGSDSQNSPGYQEYSNQARNY